jgi:Tol biopolymer transport system component
LKNISALFCLLAALAAVSPSDAAPPAKSSSCSATFTGRIAFTTGVIQICDGATGVVVNTGVSGVNPKFSPDSSLIVYQGKGVTVIKSVAPFTPRVVTATGGTPSFDPSGTQIAFDNGGIWKINIDGSGLTQLTHDGGIQPSWSPDGTQIAYNAAVGGSEQIFLVNFDGTNRHQALTSASVIDTVWRPSPKIVFGLLQASKNYELYSYDPTNPASLTRLTTIRGNDDEPSWSPDGTHISWTSGSGGIWIMNADGTDQQGPVIANGRQGSWGN